jgi:hypothetical protein
VNAAPRGAARANIGAAADGVVSLVAARIERALVRRERYRCVRPQVEREGGGWKVMSPNCSRKVDAAGGTIAIAWLEPDSSGRWRLYARDHALAAWVPVGVGLTLDQALQQLCTDARREFWQ